jgi:hypothetical protein
MTPFCRRLDLTAPVVQALPTPETAALDELRACRLTIGSTSLPSALAEAQASLSVTTAATSEHRAGP